MTDLAIDRSEVRSPLSHVALCFTVAGGLGFIAAGLTGLELNAFMAFSNLGEGVLAFVCLTACFAIFWCSSDGPDRWRPFILSRRASECIFGSAAATIALGGLAAVTAVWFG